MTEAAPGIRPATTEDRDRAIQTIVLGFSGDPFCRWLWPEPQQYLEAMTRLVPPFAGSAFEGGTAFVTQGFEAAALWLPPGGEPDGEAMEALIGETVAPEMIERVVAVLEEVDRYHPQESIWYLPLIGADPLHVGKGHGGALMRHVLDEIDRRGDAAYLESSNPRNISLYLRHGFEILGEVKIGDSPVMTPMLRPARRLH